MSRWHHLWGVLVSLTLGCMVSAEAVAKNLVEQPPNLRIKEIPRSELSSLHMRVAAGEAEQAASAASPTTDPEPLAVSSPSYTPWPSGVRDLRNRVVFKTNIGYGLDQSRHSGAEGLSGLTPEQLRDAQGDEFASQRHYLLGDAIVGSRGILRPSLNTYFLSRFRLNVGGGEFAARQSVYDAEDALPVLIRAGYAEIKGLGGETGGVLDSIFVRAGRQFRYGSDRFVSNFDGLTVAYDHQAAKVSAFVGRRVSPFFNDNPGIVAGVGLKLHGKELLDYPVDLNMDYLRFDAGNGQPGRQIIEAVSRARVAASTLVYLRGRFIADEAEGASAGLGRLGAQVRQNINPRLLLVADVEHNFDRELNFDYVGSSPIDIINVGERLGLGIGAPQQSTLLGARASYQVTREIETYAFYRNRIVNDAAEADAFSRPFQEFGFAASSLLGKRLTTTAQYKYRRRTLEASANEDGRNFSDTAGTGSKELHELSTQIRYNFGKKKASAALGGYLQINKLETPYVSIENDSLGGGRFDVGFWPTSLIRVRAEGEVARPSQTLSPDIDAIVSLRLLLEASF